jgi:hypothetical protein
MGSLVTREPINMPTLLDVDCTATPASMTRLPMNKAARRPNQSETNGEKGKPCKGDETGGRTGRGSKTYSQVADELGRVDDT